MCKWGVEAIECRSRQTYCSDITMNFKDQILGSITCKVHHQMEDLLMSTKPAAKRAKVQIGQRLGIFVDHDQFGKVAVCQNDTKLKARNI